MSVYASICMYFYQKYMHIHQAVYERISNSISGSIFVCISNSISCCIFRDTATVPSRLLRIRRRRRAVSAPSPRGRYGKFVARQRKRRQIATFNQIRSARMNFEQRQPAATCTGAPLQKCHGNLGWQSFTR
jgi:hypothetical protein